MGELESLGLILTLIYLAECLVWVRRGAVAVIQWWGCGWRLAYGGAVISNQHGGFLFANPLPPLGTVFLGHPFQVSLSDEAVFAYSAACLSPAGRAIQTGKFLRWDDVRGIKADGRAVRINGDVFCRTGSPMQTRRLVDLLRRIQEASPSNRGIIIKKALAESFDTEQVRARLEEFTRRTNWLRTAALSLFLYLFVVTPVVIAQFGLRRSVWGLVAGLLAHTITAAILFRHAHKAFFPADNDERFVAVLTVCLAPLTAIRACDLLSRHVLAGFHPLAIVGVLCAPGEFKEFARRVFLDLKHPILPVCPVTDPKTIETEQDFRAKQLDTVEAVLRRAHVSVEKLIAPPTRSEAGNQSYCPRCDAQFIVVQGTCADCGGLDLKAF